MTTVKDIYNYIDSFAPFDTAEDFDNVGILVGDHDSAVTKAVLSLDITNNVAEEAVKTRAELIISHHPVIFNPLKKVRSDSVVYNLAKNNLTAICAHTNLDKSPVFGVNTELARVMDLVNVRVSENNDILFVADTRESLTAEEFADIIKKNLYCESVAFTKFSNSINKVGMCSGAGGSEIFSAIAEGCDAFVTGELKHHELMAANENGMSVFVLGHFESEDVVIVPLAKRLSEKFPEVEFIKSRVFDDGVFFN